MAASPPLPATGEKFATDEIEAVVGTKLQYQRAKVSLGRKGVAVDLSPESPMPVGSYELAMIMRQLMAMNMHLAKISGLDLDAGDIEE